VYTISKSITLGALREAKATRGKAKVFLLRLSPCASFLAAVLLVGVTSASADPVQTFNGNATGTFGNGSCATCSASGSTITSTSGGQSSTITFTANQPELIAQLAPGQSANVTLGVLNSNSTLASGTNGPSFTGATFTLTISFVIPGDTSPTPGIFTATLTGQIVQGASSASLHWIGPTTLTFNSPSAGSFTLTVESLTPVNTPIDPNNTRIRAVLTYNGAAVSGAVPEPATLVLLGTGLLSVAGLGKRWKRRESGRG